MNIVCIGGGPAGLYFGLLMKQRNPAHDITVVERNLPYDTFGWGVVFSDATMENMRAHDPVSADQIQQAFNHWDDIELEFKGSRIRSGGHGFVGIGRKKLLNILQARCEALGFTLDEVAALLTLDVARACGETQALAGRKLGLIEQKIADLAAMQGVSSFSVQ